jgi:hypothetical protein
MKKKTLMKILKKHPDSAELAIAGGLGTTGAILIAEGQPIGVLPFIGSAGSIIDYFTRKMTKGFLASKKLKKVY